MIDGGGSGKAGFLDGAFDPCQTLGDRNSLGAHVGAPPHGFAAPGTLFAVQAFQAAFLRFVS
jgi:hypothetical protein